MVPELVNCEVEPAIAPPLQASWKFGFRLTTFPEMVPGSVKLPFKLKASVAPGFTTIEPLPSVTPGPTTNEPPLTTNGPVNPLEAAKLTVPEPDLSNAPVPETGLFKVKPEAAFNCKVARDATFTGPLPRLSGLATTSVP